MSYAHLIYDLATFSGASCVRRWGFASSSCVGPLLILLDRTARVHFLVGSCEAADPGRRLLDWAAAQPSSTYGRRTRAERCLLLPSSGTSE
jgi:hypothetical protein